MLLKYLDKLLENPHECGRRTVKFIFVYQKKLTLVRGGNFANWIKNQFEKASFNVAVGKGHNEMHRERAIGKLV